MNDENCWGTEINQSHKYTALTSVRTQNPLYSLFPPYLIASSADYQCKFTLLYSDHKTCILCRTEFAGVGSGLYLSHGTLEFCSALSQYWAIYALFGWRLRREYDDEIICPIVKIPNGHVKYTKNNSLIKTLCPQHRNHMSLTQSSIIEILFNSDNLQIESNFTTRKINKYSCSMEKRVINNTIYDTVYTLQQNWMQLRHRHR